jgi:hypothetical protein
VKAVDPSHMLGCYKKHVIALADRISRLNADPADLDLLMETQLYILKRILASEKRKSHYKNEYVALKSQLRKLQLPKAKAAELKQKADHIHRHADHCQWLLYAWRCFGDAVAFSYLDKWAIKPFLYNDTTPEVKQTAGHVAGKKGLHHEFALILDAKKNGVPALLTDLTNSIRHGDVCLLGASDPHVIEVKSSANVNKRTERQSKSIKNIHEYLENDEGKNVRGAPYSIRMEIPVPEENYIDLINQMIEDALENGCSKKMPEPGLHYIVQNTRCEPDFAYWFDGIAQPITHFLNEAKNCLAWGCYYPFTLSIKKPESLYAFLKGDVYIIVVFDAAELTNLALTKGFSMTFHHEGDWACELEEIADGMTERVKFKMSGHLFERIAFEFLSWKWVLVVEQHNAARCKELTLDEVGA